ncbi:MAG: prepilin peptidase [Leucobacter sp.]|nr:prepilin peptidase [Leucobacter sp.]
MLPVVIGVVGVFGVLIGSFLNVVIWRVPRGESLVPNSRCPRCEAPIRPWQNIPVVSWLALGGRCASCHERISARYPLVELATAAAFALTAWWWGVSFWQGAGEGFAPQLSAWLALIAYLWFVAAGIALTLIDLEHRRLPDRIVLPSLFVVVALLAAAALLLRDWAALGSTLGGAAALFLLYLVIAIVYPSGIGGGDVKLAPLVGAALGFVGWGALVIGAFAGFLVGAVVGLVLIALKRATRKTGVPFGPSMLAGAVVGVLWGESLLHAYALAVGMVRA